MVNSALHAIAIEEFRKSDPNFHAQYWKLVEGISNQVRQIAKEHPDELDYTRFTESYDRASAEPVLQVVIDTNQNETFVHVYIHQEKYFVVGKSGAGKKVKTADEALKVIQQTLSVI